MYISRFELRNYKSFYEPKVLELGPRFNIITGQNNAGKTALLTALNLNFRGNPHRSERTVPVRGAAVNPTSWSDVAITAKPTEVLRILQRPGQNWYIVRPDPQSQFARSLGWTNSGQQDIQRLLEHLFSREALIFQFRYQATEHNIGNWVPGSMPTCGLYPAEGSAGNRPFAYFQVNADLSYSTAGGGAVLPDSSDFGFVIANHFQSRVYRFSAERFNLGSSPHGNNPVLRSDAGNLPEVLSILQANTHRFAHFNALLRSILPQIHHVSIRPSLQDPRNVEVIVWNTEKESERIDLALPLAECGTGVGQVLAILYVMLHPETAETLLIDEPQSFLHPGAARKLVEILKVHSRQQIIIATHSATIISAAEPESIVIATQAAGESQLDQLNTRGSRTLEICLAEIGARLGDVFGADNILWVEGATEALCFPLIWNGIAKRPLMGTAIVGIRQVGDLEGRDAKRVFEIYANLSKGTAFIPPAVAFVLDRECRTLREQEEVNRSGKQRVTFLPRRMYENYLLHAEAIAAIANGIDRFSPNVVAGSEVQNLLDEMRADETFYCDERIPTEADLWIREIDGARVLKSIFATLSDSRVSYDKVRHSVALTRWLVENAPSELEGIAVLLSQILPDTTTGRV